MADIIYRTKEDIAADMMAVYEAITGRKVTDLNTQSVMRTLIDVIAQEHQETDFQISQAAFRSSLRYASGADLDAIGTDEGLSRKTTTGATGTVRLSKAEVAVSDSAVAAVGTIIVSNGTVNYKNSSPCRIFAGSTSWVVDDGGYGIIDIPFEAETSGVDTNTGAHTITQVVTAPAEVDTCDNYYAFEGGRVQETDAEFRERISYERDRRIGGSRQALLAEALAQAEVFSAAIYEWSNLPSGSKYVKPSPGEVWTYVFPTFASSDQFGAGQAIEGYEDSYQLNPQNILQRTRNALESIRAFPITVKVHHAYAVIVNVNVEVTLYRQYRLSDTSSAEQELAQRIRAHILSLKINEDLSLGHVYSLVSAVTPYKEAKVTFDITRNRTHSWTDAGVEASVAAEFDEIIKPFGSFNNFGNITIAREE